MTSQTSLLLSAAEERFGRLSPNEVQVISAAARGQPCDLRVVKPPRQTKAVRGEVLSWTWSQIGPSAEGFSLAGALVAGPIDIRHRRLAVPVSLRSCEIRGGLMLNDAAVPGLDLTGTICSRISAESIVVTGSVLLRSGFRVTGGVALISAVVSGTLDCTGAKFLGSAGDSLAMQGARLDGRMILNGAWFGGHIRMTAARIGGDLLATAIRTASVPRGALTMDGVRIGGRLLMRDGVIRGSVSAIAATVDGPVDLARTSILSKEKTALSLSLSRTGPLLLQKVFTLGRVGAVRAVIQGRVFCDEAFFANPHGVALSLREATINGDVACSGGFRTEGGISVYGADIAGDLSLRGAHIGSTDEGDALQAGAVRVGASAFLLEGEFCGEVRLPRATIAGDLNCWRAHIQGGLWLDGCSIRWLARLDQLTLEDAARRAVSATAAVVGGRFSWRDVTIAPPQTVDLSEARVGYLDDDVTSTAVTGTWPAGHLRLGGLRYHSLTGVPSNARERRAWSRARIEWLRAQQPERFSLQPYRQLAAVLASIGYDKEATAVLVASEHDRPGPIRRGLGQTLSRSMLRIVGYGYRPGGAAVALLAVAVVGAIVFGVAHDAGALVPRKGHPHFFAPAYSLDVSLPVVDLHQESRWKLTGNLAWSIYYWTQILLGWVLATLGALALTGSVRRRDGVSRSPASR